jgi:nucleoside-diphosphate kinase
MKNLKEFLLENSNPDKKIFVVIKPGFIDKAQEILDIYKNEGWTLKFSTIKQLLLSEAKELYKVHKKQDFYKDLCDYMSSGVTRAMIFTKETNDDEFKEATRIKDVIREKWGESDMRNVVHSSDSKENMEHEAGIYFGNIW